MNCTPEKENSVTCKPDPFNFLDGMYDFGDDGDTAPREVTLEHVLFFEALAQKRYDKSASTDAIRQLLRHAAAGGMSQRDFEVGAGRLKPWVPDKIDDETGLPQTNRAENRRTGFRGALWHHYMTKPAGMTLLSFVEFAAYFFEHGWLSKQQLETHIAYASLKNQAVIDGKKMFPPNAEPLYKLGMP